ncbi:MAG: hypothetical protein ACD_79C00988G0017 [uncultured bacterium]|nr:MAG: hypothetical protein ACD_79C00988G0017 [uncultured bacterium]
MASNKFTFTARVKPEVHAEILRRAKEKKITLTELFNQILEKYVSDSHQKWFEKDTQFVGRLWKKIEVEGVETRKNIFELSKGMLALIQMFQTISTTKDVMSDAIKKVNMELDRLKFLTESETEKKKEG